MEKIIRREKRGRQDGYRVKWHGYEESTWEPATDLREDVPEMVERFEKSRTPTFQETPPGQGQGVPKKPGRPKKV